MTTAAILGEDLVKRYGHDRGLAGLDLDVHQGEVYGFVGPNGAGKTTTIRLIMDLLRPTSGRLEVLGLVPARDGVPLRRRVGYLGGDFVVNGRQTGAELLSYLAHLRGGVPPARVTALAERLGLDLGRRIHSLSKGNRQKLGVIQAFMHTPDLLVLDEPTSGVDVRTRHEVLHVLADLNDDGIAVVLTTHDLNGLAAHLPRLICFNRTVVADGPPRVSGHIAYRGVLPRSAVPEHLWSPSVVLWAGPKTHLVHYPLRRGELFNLVAVFHSEQYAEGWDAAADPTELHTKFAHAQPQVRELLSKIDTWKMWVLCDREPVANWTQGRITLLGDAAHPMLQYLAAGAGMAIEDAWVLARCLAHAPDRPERALLDYQNQRYLRTGRVQYTACFFGELYHASGVARDLRKQLLGTPRARGADNPMAWLYDGIE